MNLADGSTATLRVRQKVPYHNFAVTYPWSPGFRIEPLSDAHAIVVQTQNCRLYELYNSMASGLSLYVGPVRWEEVARGVIPHALNWAAPVGRVAQWGFVRPASDAEGIPFRSHMGYQLPYGPQSAAKAI